MWLCVCVWGIFKKIKGKKHLIIVQHTKTQIICKKMLKKKPQKPEMSFLALYLEKTLGQKKKKKILYVPPRCIEMQIMDTWYLNCWETWILNWLLGSSCHFQVIIKFLLKMSHWLSEGDVLISAQNSTRNLYTLSVLEANKNMPSETSLNMVSQGYLWVSFYFVYRKLYSLAT